MQLTEQIIMKKTAELSKICHLAKNLYNLANYYYRQFLFRLEEFINYYDLQFLLKGHNAYKALPAQTSQQILRLLIKNWKSYWRSLKVYSKDPSKFLGRPRFPKYKKKSGESIVIFTNQITQIKDGYVIFPKKTNLQPLKTRIQKYQLIRIIPKGHYYIFEIIYNCEQKNYRLDSSRILSIDIGMNNLLTSANNIGLVPFIVKGKIVKTINQWYNKKRSIYRSNVNTFHNETKRSGILTKKRNNKIKDYFHKTTRILIDYCITNKIGHIIIGYNEKWKQGIKMGRKNNQNFVSVPFHQMIHMIKYKAQLVGIQVELTEESYTSKCSALDFEIIGKKTKYLGKRIERGLFQSKKGIKINADVNGAMNILRKVVPAAFNGKGIEAMVLSPKIIKIQ